MRPWRLFIHKSSTSHSILNTFIEQLEALLLTIYKFCFKIINFNCSVFLLSNHQILIALACDFVNDSNIKQVVQVISINFKELDFNTVLIEVWLLFPILNFIENKVKDSRNNTDLLKRKTYSASCSHCVRFSTACLAIGKDCRIVTRETSKNQVLSTRLK